jgi:hypothetical protein
VRPRQGGLLLDLLQPFLFGGTFGVGGVLVFQQYAMGEPPLLDLLGATWLQEYLGLARGDGRRAVGDAGDHTGTEGLERYFLPLPVMNMNPQTKPGVPWIKNLPNFRHMGVLPSRSTMRSVRTVRSATRPQSRAFASDQVCLT